jgi:hypothetical protein
MDALKKEIFKGYRIYLPETGIGVVPLSKTECSKYLFTQKEKEKEPTTIIPVQPAYIAEQLSLF